MKINIKHTIKIFLAVSSLVVASITNADDTEVFYSINVSKPNLLFVLDNSGSMKWDLNGNSETIYDNNLDMFVANPAYTPPSRLGILQQAVQTVIDEAPDNIHIGLACTNGRHGVFSLTCTQI